MNEQLYLQILRGVPVVHDTKVMDLERAESEIFKAVQRKAFAKEISIVDELNVKQSTVDRQTETDGKLQYDRVVSFTALMSL